MTWNLENFLDFGLTKRGRGPRADVPAMCVCCGRTRPPDRHHHRCSSHAAENGCRRKCRERGRIRAATARNLLYSTLLYSLQILLLLRLCLCLGLVGFGCGPARAPRRDATHAAAGSLFLSPGPKTRTGTATGPPARGPRASRGKRASQSNGQQLAGTAAA